MGVVYIRASNENKLIVNLCNDKPMLRITDDYNRVLINELVNTFLIYVVKF